MDCRQPFFGTKGEGQKTKRSIMKRIKMSVLVLVIVPQLLSPILSFATMNDPRDPWPAPDGSKIFLYYQRFISADSFYKNGTKLDGNADLDFTFGLARYVQFWGLGDDWTLEDGWTFSADIIQVFGQLDLESNILGIDAQSNAIGDTTLGLHIDFPCLINTNKVQYRISPSIFITAPTGDYDNDDAVNIAENMWAVEFEFYPMMLHFGKTYIEIAASAKFFSDNDDYSPASVTLERDPEYLVQGHISYDITDSGSFWVGTSYYFKKGNENEADGVNLDNETETQIIRFTAAMQLSPQTLLSIQYQTDLEVENGTKENFIGARIAYLF